jgi:hypothetical protein
MIPITPQMIGPGIDEEYADALERIEKLEAAVKGVAPSNDTREGRMVYQLLWLRQEITARRLPLPLDDKYWGTLGYLVAEGSLDHLGIAKPMGELATILTGTGLLKKRHYPVVVAMLDDCRHRSRWVPVPPVSPVTRGPSGGPRMDRCRGSGGERRPVVQRWAEPSEIQLLGSGGVRVWRRGVGILFRERSVRNAR